MAKSKWTPHKRVKALEMYTAGEDMKVIAKAIGIYHNTVKTYVKQTHKALHNAAMAKSAETTGNQYSTNADDIRLTNPALADQAFLDLLSAPDSEVLTDAEMKFCWKYTATSDYILAAKDAGFDVGLFTEEQIKGGKRGEKSRVYADTFLMAIKLRVAALRMKPNVIKHLAHLKETSLFDTEKVNKQYLQKIIVSEVEDLKSVPTGESAKLRRDYVQMLGRTFGGFTEKVEIGMIDHRKSVTKLGKVIEADTLEMLRAKKEAERAVSNGSDGSGGQSNGVD